MGLLTREELREKIDEILSDINLINWDIEELERSRRELENKSEDLIKELEERFNEPY